ncbi:MAG: 8-amino-7-oxononanoate synthase [Myxococcaceae bacterium]
MSRARNTSFVVQAAEPGIARARDAGLMHTHFSARDGKTVRLPDGREAVEFINCSYLGLDTHPRALEGARRLLDQYGLHFCCARTRLSIEPNVALEDKLSRLFRGHAITFPSVTTAHMSTLPLLASGDLLPDDYPRRTRFVFDKNSHASMQFLRPVIAEEAEAVTVIGHNDLNALEDELKGASARGQTVVYLADGVYSMGGVCPLPELLELSERYPLVLYLDDAHGTSIFGKNGEGYARGAFGEELPGHVFITYSLAKGFGCNGGGVLLPSKWQAERVRSFGMTYAFSAPLDFSVVGAALEVVELHLDGTVEALQKTLRARVAKFDEQVGCDARDFSPIRTVAVGDEDLARALGEALLACGYLPSVAFFPVVARGKSILRLCLTVEHTDAQLEGFARALADARERLERPGKTA